MIYKHLLKVSMSLFQKGHLVFLFSVMGLILSSFQDSPEKAVIYLVGDSTMSEKEVRSFPETGWGMPFKSYFSEEVIIENHARNGRSTRTFIQEGLWEP
ncbi:MAG: hypothetical protein WD597_13315, partial [Balneolaceae bacterium]